MAKRTDADPSPLRAAIVHTGLSMLVFGGAVGVMGAGIQLVGDPEAAGPREIVALFETEGVEAPALKTRIDDQRYDVAVTQIAQLPTAPEGAQPSLGIPDPDQPVQARRPVSANATQQIAMSGVRINGQIVMPGQSLSQVAETEQAEIPIIQTAQPADIVDVFASIPSDGLYASTGSGRVPVIAADGRRVETTYARPFANPEGKPTVSIIIRGLGTNRSRRYTNAAIEELPPEVTLSFVANASGLSGLVQRAQAAGHEVLLEVPMQPYSDGRRVALPQRLNTGLSEAMTVARLEWQLARTKGYFGVMNNLGGKFATDTAVVQPMMANLAARGIAFIEDGNLPSSVFAETARQEDTNFLKANYVIDTQMDASEIETKLLTLESVAIEKGHALGTGTTYPVTIDTVKAWAARLEAKDILLAPASYIMNSGSAGSVTRQAQLPDTLQTNDRAEQDG